MSAHFKATEHGRWSGGSSGYKSKSLNSKQNHKTPGSQGKGKIEQKPQAKRPTNKAGTNRGKSPNLRNHDKTWPTEVRVVAGEATGTSLRRETMDLSRNPRPGPPSQSEGELDNSKLWSQIGASFWIIRIVKRGLAWKFRSPPPYPQNQFPSMQ
jgi:hypothetical protein